MLLAGSAFFGTGAHAAATVYNTSAGSIECDSLVGGSASIKPAISNASTGTATFKVKGTLMGCAATGATPAGLSIVSGSVSGTLTAVGAPGCAGLIAPATITGNLVIKWKTASGQKLDFGSTTVSGGNITGGVFAPGGSFGTASYGQFTLNGGTIQANSAFAAGTPSVVAATTLGVGTLAAACGGSGIKTIALSFGVTKA